LIDSNDRVLCREKICYLRRGEVFGREDRLSMLLSEFNNLDGCHLLPVDFLVMFSIFISFDSSSFGEDLAKDS
jgi:hypothetical protein